MLTHTYTHTYILIVTNMHTYTYIIESVLDQSIEKAVKQMLNDDIMITNATVISPLESFNEIYRELKSNNTTDGVNTKKKLSADEMLSRLFPDAEIKNDPFDEKKVMIKLRSLMNHDDFDELFKDPNIGHWL